MPEIVVADPADLAETLATRFLQEAQAAWAGRGRFAFALPGGSVADLFFPRLARVPLDWSRTHVFWGDERAVPPDHVDSNYAAAQRLWLGPDGVPASAIHRMPADATDLASAASAHDAEVRQIGLDLVLLGMGPDGHVCSLFPGHPLLLERSRWVAEVTDSPKPPPHRLTLTLPALASATLVVVAAVGASKAAPIRAALHDPASQLPVALVARQSAHALFLLDPAAANGA